MLDNRACHVGRGDFFVIERFGVIDDFLAGPAEVKGFPYPGVYRPIAHENDLVIELEFAGRHFDDLALDMSLFPFEFLVLAITEQNRNRVVVVINLETEVRSNGDDGEGAIGQIAAMLRGWKGLNERGDRLLHGDAAIDHLHEHSRGKGREDVRGNPRAKTVGQNESKPSIIRQMALDMVAAKFLTKMIQGDGANFKL